MQSTIPEAEEEPMKSPSNHQNGSSKEDDPPVKEEEDEVMKLVNPAEDKPVTPIQDTAKLMAGENVINGGIITGNGLADQPIMANGDLHRN